jgi:hypothetical protein
MNLVDGIIKCLILNSRSTKCPVVRSLAFHARGLQCEPHTCSGAAKR